MSLQKLNKLYYESNDPAWLKSDPLGRIDFSLAPEDFELVSLIVASLSYGRVEQIQKSVDDLFKRLKPLLGSDNGSGLAAYLKNWDSTYENQIAKAFHGWKHRLNTPNDLLILFFVFSSVLKRHKSLCRLFQISYHQNPKEHLIQFCKAIFELHPDSEDLKILRKNSTRWAGTGLAWFFCSPQSGSTCKRLMMWLRWMIRQDRVDPGVWLNDNLVDETLPPPSTSRLFYPVDTHIFQWAKSSGICTASSSPTWKTVEEITAHFQNLEPEDPVRYDFAICHMGMKKLRQKPSTHTITASV